MSKLDSDADVLSQGGWASVLDKLILGVTHQISNRVATLAGVSDILAGDPTIPPILRALADEVPKLEESIRLLRLLAAPEGEAEEPLEVPRLVADAIALARLHPDCKDATYQVDDGRDVPPVLARPVNLTHELLVALTASRHDGEAIRVRYAVDGDDVLVVAGDSVVRAVTLVAARRA